MMYEPNETHLNEYHSKLKIYKYTNIIIIGVNFLTVNIHLHHLKKMLKIHFFTLLEIIF